MKYLFVGDIHNHNYIFNDVNKLDTKYNFDRIIFVGDYVDDWDTTNKESIETLNTLFKLKKKNKDKYILLIGNHELSYLGFPCSGHKYELEEELAKLLKDNIKLLDFYTEVQVEDKNYVCTHAGLTNDYITEVLDEYGSWRPVLSNLNKSKLNNLTYLRYCSYRRGGNDLSSSFVWADRTEHLEKLTYEEPIVPYQIIGHSPVSTVCNDIGENYEYFYIDTHSTYRDGRPYGDKSYLMLDENEFRILNI